MVTPPSATAEQRWMGLGQILPITRTIVLDSIDSPLGLGA